MPTFPAPSIIMTGRQINKQINFQQTLPTASDTYGVIVSFDFAQPEDTFTVEISHLQDSDIASYITSLATIGSTLDITDDKGKTWTGKVLGISYTTTPGTVLYQSIRISMRSVLITDN